jgi:hypothetical protein
MKAAAVSRQSQLVVFVAEQAGREQILSDAGRKDRQAGVANDA